MGIVAKFRNTRSYAEGGMVHIVDENTGDEKHLSYRDFVRDRIKGHLMAFRDRATSRSERAEYQKAMDDALEVAFEARRQGEPLRPMSAAERAHAEQMTKDRLQEAWNDTKKILTPSELRQISPMAEKGYTPSIVDEFGNRLV